jgi:hypothetical protein
MTQTARYKYKTDKGNVFYARTDSDTQLNSIRGSAPSGTPIENITFKASKGAKEVGCKPREAILARIIGTEDDGNCITDTAQRYKYVVVLTPENVDKLIPGQTRVTVDGTQYLFKGMSEEKMR